MMFLFNKSSTTSTQAAATMTSTATAARMAPYVSSDVESGKNASYTDIVDDNNIVRITDDDSKKGNTDRSNELETEKRFRFRSQRVLTEEEKRTRCIAWTALIVTLLVVIVVLIIVCLRKVDETEYGVRYTKYKKELSEAAVSGGLFAGPPGYEMIKFPSTYLTADFDETPCVSRDGLRVEVSVMFQYQMTAENILPAIIKYRNVYKWREIVEQSGLSAIHHSCGNFNTSDFQNKRGEIQEKMLQNLKIKLEGDKAGEDISHEGVYAVAISVQLRNVELPDEYSLAVEEKQAAEEDIALAVAQRQQEITKARTEQLKAQEEARKILNTAKSEAEVLLTEASLKANETIFAFEKEAETILEVKNSLNLTTEGVLTYLANSLYSEVKHLKVTTGEPAKLGRVDEL